MWRGCFVMFPLLVQQVFFLESFFIPSNLTLNSNKFIHFYKLLLKSVGPFLLLYFCLLDIFNVVISCSVNCWSNLLL